MTPVDVLHEGHVVSDRFQLLRLIGRGGMGSVWVARHLSLKIDVAIKFIDAALSQRGDLRSRFAQEAQTSARIQSPHVVHILDYGFDGERPFIAMELLEGESLGARVKRVGRIPLSEIATILAQAAKGLSRAHALGIVHRDLKPDNLFLCKDDDGSILVKILDFGIAREESGVGVPSHRTGTGQILGTPAYMSPEQALAKGGVDFRSDLYSLAVVAYHCIVGRLPFETDSLPDLIVSLVTSEPPPPSSLVSGLPAGLDSWFRCAFSKEPSARFGSAKELADTFALACRESSAAFEATVLADPTKVPSAPPRKALPERTKLLTGIVAPGPAAPPPGGMPTMGATPVGAPQGPYVGAPSMGASPIGTMPSTPVRTPDTFNGQYATKPGAGPRVEPRSVPPVVLVLVGVVIVVGLVGAGLVVTHARLSSAPPPVPDAVAASVATPTPPAPPTPPPAPSVAPAPPTSAATHAPVAAPVAPPTPRPPTPVHRAPVAVPAPAPPPPKPIPPKPAATNDYGL